MKEAQRGSSLARRLLQPLVEVRLERGIGAGQNGIQWMMLGGPSDNLQLKSPIGSRQASTRRLFVEESLSNTIGLQTSNRRLRIVKSMQ